MSSRKAITWTLTALLALLMWDFVGKAFFYDPLAQLAPQQEQDETELRDETPLYEQAWGADIVKKNLFSETRTSRNSAPSPINKSQTTSMPVAPLQQEQPTEVRPRVKLSGIIKNQFGEYVVFLQFDNESTMGARAGETVMGLKVVEIEKRKVTLKWKDSTFELSMSGQSLIKR